MGLPNRKKSERYREQAGESTNHANKMAEWKWSRKLAVVVKTRADSSLEALVPDAGLNPNRTIPRGYYRYLVRSAPVDSHGRLHDLRSSQRP